ncbi:MAG: hypothetical protein OEN23_00125 [Paracoccaceae bacterium]|nr:hypothetical protein [Paracoccaceae bacterium]
MNDDSLAKAEFSLEGGPAFVVILAIMVVVYGIPAMRVVRRAGFVQWWGLLAAVPLVNIVALWIFAYREWPSEEGK